MKKALVATAELITHYKDQSVLGYRITDVHDTEIFAAAPDMFWIDVDDNFDMGSAAQNYYNPQTKTVEATPIDPEVIKLGELMARRLNEIQQPITSGTQSI